jgi:hypothetical protein
MYPPFHLALVATGVNRRGDHNPVVGVDVWLPVRRIDDVRVDSARSKRRGHRPSDLGGVTIRGSENDENARHCRAPLRQCCRDFT